MSQEFELAMNYLDTYNKTSRQRKLNSSKNKQHAGGSYSNTMRNKEQKYYQSRKTSIRKHYELETMQKAGCDYDGKNRQYYCSFCLKTFNEPCRCGWVKWCGNEDSTWDKCYYGIDDLCDWHVREYYLQND